MIESLRAGVMGVKEKVGSSCKGRLMGLLCSVFFSATSGDMVMRGEGEKMKSRSDGARMGDDKVVDDDRKKLEPSSKKED